MNAKIHQPDDRTLLEEAIREALEERPRGLSSLIVEVVGGDATAAERRDCETAARDLLSRGDLQITGLGKYALTLQGRALLATPQQAPAATTAADQAEGRVEETRLSTTSLTFPTLEQAVLGALARASQPLRARDIANCTGWNKSSIATTLGALAKTGKIVRVEPGLYRAGGATCAACRAPATHHAVGEDAIDLCDWCHQALLVADGVEEQAPQTPDETSEPGYGDLARALSLHDAEVHGELGGEELAAMDDASGAEEDDEPDIDTEFATLQQRAMALRARIEAELTERQKELAELRAAAMPVKERIARLCEMLDPSTPAAEGLECSDGEAQA